MEKAKQGKTTLQMVIHRLQTEQEAQACAELMSSSEPWVSLDRTYATSLSIMQDSEREVFVASQDGQVIGFIVINMHGAFIGYIQSLCVAPAWRGFGVGTRLIRLVEKRIFQDSPNVFICASSINPKTQKFYEKLGYTVIGPLKNFILPDHDEILLRKSIAPLIGFEHRGHHKD